MCLNLNIIFNHIWDYSKLAVAIFFLFCLFLFGPGVQKALSTSTNMGAVANNMSHVTGHQTSSSQTNSNSTQASPRCAESTPRKNKMGIPDKKRINPPKGKKNSASGSKKNKRKSKKNTANNKYKSKNKGLSTGSISKNLITKKIGSAPLLKRNDSLPLSIRI
jgi:hypothetical protein